MITKARNLISECGLAPTNRDDVFSALSSDGVTKYLCSPQGWCFCPAGLNDLRCYHVLAAQLLVAETLREEAAARGIRVLPTPSDTEPLGEDPWDMYGLPEHDEDELAW